MRRSGGVLVSLTPLSFTGISSYSSDFQAIIDRAVSIASIPLQSLQNQQTDVMQQKVLVGNLSSAADALATSLKKLGSVGANKALSVSSSNTALVTATNGGSSSAATYTITDITSLAKVASETSVNSYASSSSTAVAATPATVKLIAGTKEKSLDISGNNTLIGLRDAINSANMGVTATILTVSATENYLSVSADSAGATTLRLVDDPSAGTPVDLLKSLNQGANTVFKLNGALVSKSSTQINDVIPGVVLNILGTTETGKSVDVSVASDRSTISSALNEFVSAYNAMVDQVNAQVGEDAGLLSGDYLVRLVQENLRQVASFSGTGSIKNLSDLGIEFDKSGKVSLNTAAFSALSDAQVVESFDFFGSEYTAFGGLSSLFTQISDPVMGLAQLQQNQYDAADKRLTENITKTTEHISAMQEILSEKLIAADALLGQMESQQRIIESSIESLKLVLYGKNEG